MKTLILIGGKGTRMYPASEFCPKEMFPIFNKPLLLLIVKNLKKNNIKDEDVFFILNKEKKEIINYFKKLKYNFNFIFDEGKGLGNAILSAESHLNNEPFLLLLGDMFMYSQFDLIKNMIKLNKKTNANILGSFHSKLDEFQYCSIEEKNGKCIKLFEKPKKSISQYSTTGQYIFNFSILKFLKKEKNSLDAFGFTNAINNLIKEELVLHCFDKEGIMIDVGNPKAYAKSIYKLYINKIII